MDHMKDRTAKLLIIGDASVGKSSILLKYTDGIFEHNTLATLGIHTFSSKNMNLTGMDYRRKNVQVEGYMIRLEMWDTSGQEKYRCLAQTFFRGCMGIIIVFDLTNRQSLQNVEYWLSSLEKHGSADLYKMLIGNKCDLERAVTEDEIKKIQCGNNLPYFETSAKSGENIDKVFDVIAEEVYKRYYSKEEDRSSYKSIYLNAETVRRSEMKKKTSTPCCN